MENGYASTGRPLTVDPVKTVAGTYEGRQDTPENRAWWDRFKTYNGLDRWIMAGRPSGQEDAYYRGAGLGSGGGTGAGATGTIVPSADDAARVRAEAALGALHQQYATMLIQYGQQTGYVMEFTGKMLDGGIPEITYRMDNGKRIPLSMTPDGAATAARESAQRMIDTWKVMGRMPDPRDPTGKTLMDIPYFADAHEANQSAIELQQQQIKESGARIGLDRDKFVLEQQKALADAAANPYRSVEAGALARMQGVNMGGVPMYGQAVSSGSSGVAPGFLPAGTGTGTGTGTGSGTGAGTSVGTRGLGAMPDLGSTLTGIGAGDVQAAQDATPMAFSPNASAMLRGSAYVPSGSNKSGSLGQMSTVGDALRTSGDLGRLSPVAWRNLDDQSRGIVGSLAQAGGMSADQQNRRIRSQLPGTSISTGI